MATKEFSSTTRARAADHVAPCMMYIATGRLKIALHETQQPGWSRSAIRYRARRSMHVLRQLCRLHDEANGRSRGQPYDRPRCTMSHMNMREQMPRPYKNCVHATPPADYDMTEEEVEAVVLAN